jgi:hypothetical protein
VPHIHKVKTDFFRGKRWEKHIQNAAWHLAGLQVRTFDMAKQGCKPPDIPVKQSKNHKISMAAKFNDISCQLPASLLDVSGATREHWWMNEKY